MFKKFAVALGATAVLAGAAQAETFTGAGATFPAPVYSAWAQTYKTATGNELNYQAIGSGGGIRQIKAKTVDFGASDKPLKAEELNEAGLMQFPTVIGGVVPVVNIEGIKPGDIHLTGELLGDIFLGKVKTWNAPAITELNPGVNLPKMPITVVHRSDGSGTSFVFTSYLSEVNPEWKDKVGASDSVPWPVGLGGKGNDGVAAFVKQTKGSIGYVEYAYAKQNGMSTTLLKNKNGNYATPTADNFAAAAAGADWAHAEGNYLMLVNQPGDKSWPISAATFILIHKQPANPAAAAAVLKFFDWAYKNGNDAASQLDYVPLPDSVKEQMRGQWSQVQANGKPVYTPE